MKELEQAMFEYHRLLKLEKSDVAKTPLTSSSGPSDSSAITSSSSANRGSEPPKPVKTLLEAEFKEADDAFYLVNNVFEGSPANTAGLLIGDKILRFGSVVRKGANRAGVGPLLQQVVASSVGSPIEVIVYRNGIGVVGLRLTPKSWEGRGLLGCGLGEIN